MNPKKAGIYIWSTQAVGNDFMYAKIQNNQILVTSDAHTQVQLLESSPNNGGSWLATLSDVLRNRESLDEIMQHRVLMTSTRWVAEHIGVVLHSCPLLERPLVATHGPYLINEDENLHTTLSPIMYERDVGREFKNLAYVHLPDPLPRESEWGVVAITKGMYPLKERYDIYLDDSRKCSVGNGAYIIFPEDALLRDLMRR